MKHNSLALAVGAVLLGTAAGASAQSSVTIFGVMDAAIVRATGSVASTTRMNTSEALGSRLGFKGVEDLGGGLKANFMAEAGLLNDTGAGAATNTNNQATGAAGGGGLTFNRQIWVGLSGKFGEVRMGREYTPTFAAFALNDPFGANGSMVMSQAWQGAIGGLALANAVRTSNGMSYQSNADWGPVRAHLMYALGENASNAGVTADDGKTIGVRLTYNTKALNVDLAHQRYTLAAIGGMRETFLGGTLPLGATNLYGQYMTESTGSSNSMKGYSLGVSHTMGVVDLKAAYSRSALKSAAGANIGTTGRIALGAYYNLSKRTALFTQIVSVTNADGAANTVFPSYGAVTAANNGSRGYAVGIRHSF